MSEGCVIFFSKQMCHWKRDNKPTAVEVESGGMLESRALSVAFQGAGSLGAERKPWAAGSLRLESEYTNEYNLH